MSKYVILITTTNNKEEAEKIAKESIENKLAACAQIYTINSLYWWNKQIEKSIEYRIEFKTTKDKSSKLKKLIKSLHSYQVPEIIKIPIFGGEKSYLKWIKDSLK